MINENKTLIKAKLKSKKSTFKQKIFTITEKFYEVNYYIVNCTKGYLWWNILSLIIQYLEIISYIFDATLTNLWKQPKLISNIKLISNYIFLVPLIRFNKIIYLTVLNFIIVMIIFFAIFSTIIILTGKFNIKENRKLLITFRTIIEGISFTFFGHLIFLIISIYLCIGKNAYFEGNDKCKIGLWYKIDSILGIITIIILLIISFFSVSSFFIPSFVTYYKENDVLKKTNNAIDKSFIINKILIPLLFLVNQYLKYEWEIIIVLLISTGIHLYNIFYHRSYENDILLLLHKFLGFILFWGVFSFSIGKVLGDWKFDGGIYLFFSGLLLFVVYFFYKKKNEQIMYFYSINFNFIESSEERLFYIKQYLSLLKNKSKDRLSNIIFQSLIGNKEDYCIKVNCKLKQYLELSSQGYESDYLLLQYCQQLFESSILKFPNDVILKCNYIIFLVVYLNEKKLAYRLLSTLNEKLFHIQDNYIIFYCKKYIGKCSTFVSKNEDTEINKNILKSLEYKNLFNEFLDQLNKISSLYIDFWSSLLNYHLQGVDNLTKLNVLGSKINKLIDDINDNFERLHRVKSDDLKVVKLYYSFVKDILNDKKKRCELQAMMIHFNNRVKIDDREIDYKNYDLRILSDNDDYRYLIISTNEKKVGNIIDISLNSCKIFGYTKNELIGKDIHILIPQIYHKKHSVMLFDYIIHNKNIFYESLYKKNEFKPHFTELFSHGINKSKYLVPIYLKTYLVQTEESDIVVIVEFSKEEDVLIKKQQFENNKINNNNLNVKNTEDCCCVLTDTNFMIQEFTANSAEILGLTSSAINSNYYIINFIKQFNDEIFISSNNIEASNNEITSLHDYNINDLYGNSRTKNNIENIENNIPVENIIKNAKELIKEEYNKPKKILWKYSVITEMLKNVSNFYKQMSIPKKRNNILSKKTNSCRRNSTKCDNDRTLLLEIDQSKITGKLVGYKFYFKRWNFQSNFKANVNKKQLSSKNNIKPKKTKFVEKEKDSRSHLFFSDSSYDNKKESENINTDSLIKIEECNNNNEDINDLINQNIERIKTKTQLTKDSSEDDNEIKYANSDVSIRNKNSFNINENYIPKTNFNFNLDLNNMSYFGIHKIIDSNKFNNSLKELTDEKIKFYEKENQTDENIASSSQYSDEENEEDLSNYISNSSENIESNENSSDIKNSSNKKVIESHRNSAKAPGLNSIIKVANKINEINGEYYKVRDLSKIRFMEFDFEKEMIVENEKFEKKSEIEKNLINYKYRIFNQLDKDAKYPLVDLKNYHIGKKEEKNHKFSSQNEIKEVKSMKKNLKKISAVVDKENELFKYIEDGLNRNNKEKSIVTFSIIAFCCFFIILIALSSILYFILKSLQTSKINVFLLKNSINMRYYYSMGVFYVRELVLLNMNNNVTGGNYTNIPDRDKANYTSKLCDLIKQTYFNSQSSLENILGTKFTYYKNTYEILNTNPLTSKIFYDQERSGNLTTNLITSIIQANSAFNLLVITPSNIKQTSIDLYDFMYNTMNNVGKGLEIIIEIFITNLNHRYHKNLLYIVIFLPIMFLVFVIIFFIITKYYILIAKRKSNYIDVFYGIGISLIKSSIKKCEIFKNELNKNDLLIYKEKEESQQNENSSENSAIKNKENFEEKDDIVNQSAQYRNKNFQQGTTVQSYKIELTIFLLVAYLAILITSIYYLQFLNKISKYEAYGYHMQRFHNGFINLINCYREFLFDNNSIIYNNDSYNTLKSLEKELYNENSEDVSYLDINNTIIPTLSQKYNELFERNLCTLKNDGYFINYEECVKFMGYTISLGFYNLIAVFIEEVRIERNLAKYYMDNNMYVGNLSRAGIDTWENEKLILKNDNNIKFRMELFNDFKLHGKMNIIFSNLVLPFIESQKEMTLTEIDNAMISVDKIYIILYSIFYVLLFCYVCGFWIIKIENIKNIIYNTKNMLSIIPKQILALQSSIRTLLDIPEDI